MEEINKVELLKFLNEQIVECYDRLFVYEVRKNKNFTEIESKEMERYSGLLERYVKLYDKVFKRIEIKIYS